MNFKKLIAPFKRRLLPEQLGHASMIGISVAAGGVFLTSLVYHILCFSPEKWLLAAIGGGLFLLTFTICMLTVDRPGTRKTASRIDELGLNDRVATMLEFRDDTSEIAALQRSDALDKLQAVKPASLKRQFSTSILVVMLAFTLGMTVMLVLPYDIFAKASAPVDEHEQYIKELISDLRKQLEEIKNADDVLAQITEVIEGLESDLANPDLSDEELAAKIDSAQNKIDKILDEAITRTDIGEALQRFILTRALGEAISDGDEKAVQTALVEMYDVCQADTGVIQDIATSLRDALELSEVDSEDTLYQAIENFAAGLESIYAVTGPDTTAAATGQEEALNQVYGDAYNAIKAALEQQAAWEEAAGQINEILQETKDDILGKEDSENSDEEGSENADEEGSENSDEEGSENSDEEGSENQDNEGNENQDNQGSENPDGEPPEGMGDINGEGEYLDNGMNESIYIPGLGSVTYGEIYSSYYAEYLKALANGEVPEETQDAINKYYETLSGAGQEK